MLHRRLKSRLVALIVVLAFVAFAGAAAFAAPAGARTSANSLIRPAPGHKVHVVLMEMKKAQFIYDPTTVAVDVGDVIEWKNVDIYQHTVTDVNRKAFNSGMIAPGKSWSYKATKRGTFNYFCTLHPNMTGKFIVR